MNRFPQLVDVVVESPDKAKKGPAPYVGIIIHHTDLGPEDHRSIDEQGWHSRFENITRWLALKDDIYVSAHFHIGRFGECAQLVDPDTHIAYHAGESWFWHPIERRYVGSWNQFSIGIELLGDGNRKGFVYTEEQYEKCAKLCAALMGRYTTISPLCIVGHEVIAPKRKVDPGRAMNWRYLYQLIFKHLGEDIQFSSVSLFNG